MVQSIRMSAKHWDQWLSWSSLFGARFGLVKSGLHHVIRMKTIFNLEFVIRDKVVVLCKTDFALGESMIMTQDFGSLKNP